MAVGFGLGFLVGFLVGLALEGVAVGVSLGVAVGVQVSVGDASGSVAAVGTGAGPDAVGLVAVTLDPPVVAVAWAPVAIVNSRPTKHNAPTAEATAKRADLEALTSTNGIFGVWQKDLQFVTHSERVLTLSS